MRRMLTFSLIVLALPQCGPGQTPEASTPASLESALSDAAFWNSATVYFLLTDRFHNGDASNDLALGRQQDGAVLRSFQGGDLAGILQKLEEGYFDALGVNAIWMTPFVEQIHGSVDEGTGKTYGFHGYWTRDWTAVDPALGTVQDLEAVVDAAHERGIRVLMDAVINHTGPVTAQDPQWPDDWVRTGPRCVYQDYRTTVDCTLVDNLPDVRTGSDVPVELPAELREKWAAEGRLEQEMAELEAFFQRTGHPRAPRHYIIKWLTDWVRELGFDGYRVDTAKHFEEDVSVELKEAADEAFADWKRDHPGELPGDRSFHMMGEVYNYEIHHGRNFDFGGGDVVDFYDHGYDALISFSLKRDASGDLDDYFTRYARALRGDLEGVSVLHYLSSHDDGAPWDPGRADPLGAATRLLLAPGGAQIYYGDETARPLRVDGAAGDANLRSVMNWEDVDAPEGRARETLEHWRRVGAFRRAHPAVGAGEHRRIRADPYVFARTLEAGAFHDRVLVATDMGAGEKTIPVSGVFPDGVELVDAYSGQTGTVSDGEITLTTSWGLVLLGESR